MSTVVISRFADDTAAAPGYDTRRSVNLYQALPTTAFQLGKPAVSGDRIAVGTDDPNGAGRLLCVDGEVMSTSLQNPVVSTIVLSDQHIRDTHWMSQTTIVCAAGEGHLQLFNIRNNALTLQRTESSLHRGFIREIAVKEGETYVASGGFDGCLCVSDMNSSSSILQQRVHFPGEVIGSVKWPTFTSSINTHNMCVSCTVDEGYYMLFDTRVGLHQIAIKAQTHKKDLFSHARYTGHHVLLGYGDGEIKQIDMRQPQHILLSVFDPYVEGVGNIEYCPGSGSFVVSGYTESVSTGHCGR